MTKRRNLIEEGLNRRKSNEKQAGQVMTSTALPTFSASKSVAEMVGAFKGFAVTNSFARIMQGRIIDEVKTSKKFLELGYKNFSTFCQCELKISHTTANQIAKERHDLGIEATETLITIGLKPKDLKVLTSLKSDDGVEISDNKLKIDNGVEIDLVPDNIELIQDVIDTYYKEMSMNKKALKKLATSHNENLKKIKELKDQLNKPIPVEISEFEKNLEPYKIQFDTLYGNLDKLKKQVEKDPDKLARLKGLIAYFYEVVTTTGTSILGEEI